MIAFNFFLSAVRRPPISQRRSPTQMPQRAVINSTLAAILTETSRIVSTVTGVQLGERQAAMVEARIKRRMIELELSEGAYLERLRTHADEEARALVSLLTTHHSYFFRENAHFDFLAATALPRLISSLRAQKEKTIRIWSAACSRGQEAYSLAMHLSHHLEKLAPEMSFEIIGTDVDPQSVAFARNGVFRWTDVKSIPRDFLAGHWARGTGGIAEFAKIKAPLKDRCRFEVVNLLEPDSFLKDRAFDLVFCRNVFIYFTREQIQASVSKIMKHVRPHGYFFTGISESLFGLNLPIRNAGPSIYEHALAQAPAPSAAAKPASIRVLCVDDSPTILSLLRKILTKEHGFEIVGTAKDGIEAGELAAKIPFDVMTLDIHMPRKTGVEYLASGLRAGHPPVVMMTSVGREDADLGQKALQLGARDFVEKPSLQSLEDQADEIRIKLRAAATASKAVHSTPAEVEKIFRERTISAPDTKLRVILAGKEEIAKLQEILRSLRALGNQPPTAVFLPGNDSLRAQFAKQVMSALGDASPLVSELAPSKLAANSVHWLDFNVGLDALKQRNPAATSIMILGDFPDQVLAKLSGWPKAQALIEEAHQQKRHAAFETIDRAVMPATSFAYGSTSFLSKN